ACPSMVLLSDSACPAQMDHATLIGLAHPGTDEMYWCLTTGITRRILGSPCKHCSKSLHCLYTSLAARFPLARLQSCSLRPFDKSIATALVGSLGMDPQLMNLPSCRSLPVLLLVFLTLVVLATPVSGQVGAPARQQVIDVVPPTGRSLTFSHITTEHGLS